jgi:hypothetical protein
VLLSTKIGGYRPCPVQNPKSSAKPWNLKSNPATPKKPYLARLLPALINFRTALNLYPCNNF